MMILQAKRTGKMSGTVNFGFNIPVKLWGQLTEAARFSFPTTESYIVGLMEASVYNGYGLQTQDFARWLDKTADQYEKSINTELNLQVNALRSFAVWMRAQSL